MCGFEYHGPKHRLAFNPRLTPENFKCAFTSAEGWGSYAQKIEKGKLNAELSLRYGSVKLKTIALECPDAAARSVKVTLAGKDVAAQLARRDARAIISFKAGVEVHAGQSLVVSLT